MWHNTVEWPAALYGFRYRWAGFDGRAGLVATRWLIGASATQNGGRTKAVDAPMQSVILFALSSASGKDGSRLKCSPSHLIWIRYAMQWSTQWPSTCEGGCFSQRLMVGKAIARANLIVELAFGGLYNSALSFSEHGRQYGTARALSR